MKKMRFSRKTKVFLSFGTALLATTSIVTPLICSCSQSDDGLKVFDKQFNVTDYKNEKLRDECEIKYRDYLTHQEKPLKPAIVDEKIASLHNRLNDIIKQAKKASNSATVASNVMIDTMYDDFKIQVSRDFDASINFDLEINNFRQTCNDMIVRMMNEKKIPSSTIDAKINNFNTEFGKLRTQLSAKYIDGLSILTNIKADAMALLDGISDEMDQVVAASAFKKFSERYQFVVNEEKVKSNKSLCWNNVHEKFSDDEDVSGFAKDVLHIYDKNEKTFKDINDAADFENGNIIAGHRIEPHWRGATGDMYNNTYTISLEWRIIKIDNYNRYQAELAEKGASEIYNNTAATLASIKNTNNAPTPKSMADLLKLPSNNKSYQDFALPITADYEKTQLQEAYGKGQIQLGWDDGQGGQGSMANCAYEGYFGFENKGQQALSSTQIGAIGLTVGSAQTNSVTRLDALKEQVTSKLNAGASFDSLSLEEKFVDSVDLVTFSNITNDKKHIVNNKFYAAYKNSIYADKSDTEHTYAELGESNFTGMPISKNLYDSVWKNFHNSNEESRDENLKRAQKTRDSITSQFTIHSIIQCIVMISVTVCAGLLAIPFSPYKPQYIFLMIVGFACMGLNITAIVKFGNNKDDADKYYDHLKSWHDSENYGNYIDKHVKQDYNNYLQSYDTFKSAPMSEIKPIVAYYSSLQLQSEYQECIKARNDSGANYSKLEDIKKDNIENVKFSIGTALASFITTIIAAYAAHQHIHAKAGETAQAQAVTNNVVTEQAIDEEEALDVMNTAFIQE